MKLIEKHRVKSKVIKRYDSPQTPLERVLASPYLAQHIKRELFLLKNQINPYL